MERMILIENAEISTYRYRMLVVFQVTREIPKLLNKLCWDD